MSEHSTPPGGKCTARFDPLCELFAAKFAMGEDLGALLAVKIDGELVVDPGGGPADEAKVQNNFAKWHYCTILPVWLVQQ